MTVQLYNVKVVRSSNVEGGDNLVQKCYNVPYAVALSLLSSIGESSNILSTDLYPASPKSDFDFCSVNKNKNNPLETNGVQGDSLNPNLLKKTPEQEFNQPIDPSHYPDIKISRLPN